MKKYHRVFQEKHRSFKVDEEKGDKMRTHCCQTIDTRWGSDNHPHIFTLGTPSLIPGPFWDELLPSLNDTRTRSLVFSPNLPIFRVSYPPTSPWMTTLGASSPRRNCKFRPLPLPNSYSMKKSRFPAPHYLRIFRNVIRFTVSWFGLTGLSKCAFEHQKNDSAFMQQRD